MRIIIALCVAVLLAGCSSVDPPPPQIVTQEVKVAVPAPCGVTVDRPTQPMARSVEEVRQMIATATTVTERARIITDQLLLWLDYGPRLEAVNDGCRKITTTPEKEDDAK